MVLSFSPGPLEPALDARMGALRGVRFAERLRAKDPSLWAGRGRAVQSIRARLGWIDPFRKMEEEREGVLRFAREARAEFARVLLLGMGGSSLAPEVLARTFGVGGGGLPLRVLDSTDLAAVRGAAEYADREGRTLFLVASKSGSTIEVDAFRRYFTSRVNEPRAFAAITDPRSPLDELAVREGYRAVFRNPSDIGGRYSALSLFGLVPAALIGVDVDRLLTEAETAANEGSDSVSAGGENPGVHLGAFLAEGALAGRNKLTLLVSDRLPGLGAWIEQLVAESTGKEGRGILPIDLEPAGDPGGAYSADRLYVAIGCGAADREIDAAAARLEPEGLPTARLSIEDPLEIGGVFYLWEVATATASAILDVNPFDEPNVKEGKDRTSALLARYAERGALEEEPACFEDPSVQLFADPVLEPSDPSRAVGWVCAHLARAEAGDYVAFLSFLTPCEEIAFLLRDLRAAVLRARGVATVAGFGPRYLHSTGQLFKGGPDQGVFVLLTTDDREDLPIPGREYSFGALKGAQALGDFAALAERGRRVLRVHLKRGTEEGIRRLASWIEA